MVFFFARFDYIDEKIILFEVKIEQFLMPFLEYSIYFDFILKKSFVLSNLISEHYHNEKHDQYLLRINRELREVLGSFQKKNQFMEVQNISILHLFLLQISQAQFSSKLYSK